MIAEIARQVIRRLRESTSVPTASAPASPSPNGGEKLITIETLDRYAATGQILAAEGAVITPAAREEAAQRGIQIQHAASSGASPTGVADAQADTPPATQSLVPQSLGNQLARRGITLPADVEILWTDEPSAEVYRRCSGGQRAAMVGALSDVERFAGELSPNVWVLDRQKLNLVAAVNVAARIARCPAPDASAVSQTLGGSR
ncbi:hypothetical protein Enr13x_16620 [Stieleria neptunia]|uniref:Uncharacterized protein n=1 Tax=Stieleria neptunia TaxID=2527979 RepID=A0A518HM00_9BACT|nr:hypothetical protein [Stieleria neptunia]QDV41819.1 hypothetical protein Enr13x_16620 [Stieleria neptunia]